MRIGRQHRLYIYRVLTGWMPDTPKLFSLKASLLRWCGFAVGRNVIIPSSVVFEGEVDITIGDGVVLQPRVQFWGSGTINIHDHVFIGHNTVVSADGRVEIGSRTEVYQNCLLTANGSSLLSIGQNCQIAHMVSLKTSEHEINPSGNCIGGTPRFRDIMIGEGCWVCAGVVVIPGVCIGKKSIVAAGAVVTKDVPPNVLVAGVPAVVKKTYT